MRTPIAIAILVGLSSAAGAETPAEKAKAHLAIAQRMFQVQQYEQAVAELQKAYVLDPKPEYLYAIAQAFRLQGDCTKAIRGYEQYLKTNPVQVEADKARANIERCKADLAAKPPEPSPPPVPAPPPVVQPSPPPPPPPISVEHRGWTSDTMGHVLVGGGVALAVTGSLLFMTGRSTILDINDAATYDEFAMRRERFEGAQLRQRIGVAGMALGGALLIGGLVHYAVWSGRTERTVTASAGADHAVLVFVGAF